MDLFSNDSQVALADNEQGLGAASSQGRLAAIPDLQILSQCCR